MKDLMIYNECSECGETSYDNNAWVQCPECGSRNIESKEMNEDE